MVSLSKPCAKLTHSSPYNLLKYSTNVNQSLALLRGQQMYHYCDDEDVYIFFLIYPLYRDLKKKNSCLQNAVVIPID